MTKADLAMRGPTKQGKLLFIPLNTLFGGNTHLGNRMKNHSKTSRRWPRLLLLGSALVLSSPLVSCAKDSGSDAKKEEATAKTEAKADKTPEVATNAATKTANAETKKVLLNVFGMS